MPWDGGEWPVQRAFARVTDQHVAGYPPSGGWQGEEQGLR